ncbi:MAG: hypothetical protein ACFCD0_27810 [Gemmataceae bacterium]
MPDPNRDVQYNDQVKAKWTDQYVKVKAGFSELARWEGLIGRVVTVNFNGKAVIDFQDGGWYDVTASEEFLEFVPKEEAEMSYKNVNSAQVIPEKQ